MKGTLGATGADGAIPEPLTVSDEGGRHHFPRAIAEEVAEDVGAPLGDVTQLHHLLVWPRRLQLMLVEGRLQITRGAGVLARGPALEAHRPAVLHHRLRRLDEHLEESVQLPCEAKRISVRVRRVLGNPPGEGKGAPRFVPNPAP